MLPLAGLGLGWVFTQAGDAAREAVGWAWDHVTNGIFSWLLNALAVMMEWVWGMLDEGSTPRITSDWFVNEVAANVVVLALVSTTFLMLLSAAQAALSGRPEQIVDAFKHGAVAVVASAFTITFVDLAISVVDEASDVVWATGREDLVSMLESIVVIATASAPALASMFIAPVVLLVWQIGLAGLGISLMMRAALIYVVAAVAPLVWASSVFPAFRGAERRMVHLLVALVFAKLAIVVTLTVAIKLVGNIGTDIDAEGADSAVAAIGMLLTGVTCILVAAVSPVVLYKLMPTVESAAASTGIAGGWGRTALTAAQGAATAASLAATGGASAPAAAGAAAANGATSVASQPVAGQNGLPGASDTSQGPGPATDTQAPGGDQPPADAGSETGQPGGDETSDPGPASPAGPDPGVDPSPAPKPEGTSNDGGGEEAEAPPAPADSSRSHVSGGPVYGRPPAPHPSISQQQRLANMSSGANEDDDDERDGA